MSRHDEREIARRLADTPAGEPPPELLERLRDDIPEDLAAGLDEEDRAAAPPATPSPFSRPWLAAAAALVMLVAGGFLAWKVSQEVGPVGGSHVDGPPAAESAMDSAGSAQRAETGGAAAPSEPAGAAGRGPDDSRSRLISVEGEENTAEPDAAERRGEGAPVAAQQPAEEGVSPGEGAVQQETAPPTAVAEEVTAPPASGQAERKRQPAAPEPMVPAVELQEVAEPVAESEEGAVADRALDPRKPETEAERSAPAVPPPPASLMVETAADRPSTVGLDVGTGPLDLVRAHLEAGRMPPADAVRVAEVVNAQPFSDPFADAPARPGETFRVTADGAPSPFAPDRSRYLLRFRVSARQVPRGGPLRTVAEEARAQVELDPGVVESWRRVGYGNRAIADRELRYDGVDVGEIAPGRSVTALYEVKLRAEPAPGRPLALLTLRWREPAGAEGGEGRFREIEKRLTTGDLAPSWSAADPDLRLAAVAAELAEHLSGSPHATSAPSTLLTEARRLAASGVEGAAELLRLAEAWRRLGLPAAEAREPGDG